MTEFCEKFRSIRSFVTPIVINFLFRSRDISRSFKAKTKSNNNFGVSLVFTPDTFALWIPVISEERESTLPLAGARY